MKPTKKEKTPGGKEGIFYVVFFPQGWRALPVCSDPSTNADLGHPDFWEEVVAGVLAQQWHPQVSKEFPTSEKLRRELLPLVYAFPRGRVVSVGRKFAVYHGDNLEAFMQCDRKAIETCFNIQGNAEWRFDDHEQCQMLDKVRVRELLHLRHDWKAV